MLRLAAIFAVLTMSLPLLAGCGPSGSAAGQLEANELLELLQEQELKSDSQDLAEVDLGEFRITHVLEGDAGQILVKFHLIGLVPASRLSKATHALDHYKNRIRDAVIHLVQETETEQLTDPGLAFFRSEVVAAANRVLQERLLKDVVFSNFSVEAG
jgi:hypothetical protein